VIIPLLSLGPVSSPTSGIVGSNFTAETEKWKGKKLRIKLGLVGKYCWKLTINERLYVCGLDKNLTKL
jgi:hypothetical protein